MPGKELPPEVVTGIQRILKLEAPEDPLETLQDFNPVDTLNALFPDEASLIELDVVQKKLAAQQAELQKEIDSLRAELRKDQDPSRMQLIQELIAELLTQMHRIREKATESEAIVQNITKEIQVLDLAKKNLVTSITALKRLQMLGSSVTSLEALADTRNYAEIAQMLSATKEIYGFFRAYIAVPRVAFVAKRFQAVQGTIRGHLDKEFDLFFLQDPNKPVNPQIIKDACAVVDVLSEDVRQHYVDRYCTIELKEYRRIFRTTDEAGQLDNIARRFSWFRKQLASHDSEHGQVFPTSWKMGHHLVARFTDITREDLTAALSKAAPTLTVAVLLESLQMTLDFEQAMSTKYGMPYEDIAKQSTSSSAGVKLSTVFEPHMGIFVDAQDKALSDMLAPSRGAKSRPSLEGAKGTEETPITVLPSSTELFYFYGQNLEQCAKLSNRKPLWDLCNLHKKWLKIYAEDVLFATIKGTPKSERERRSLEGRFTEVRTACIILNTADYCQTTALELEEKIKERISEEYVEQVTLQTERDIFVSVISSAITVLLRELEAACEPAFLAMSKVSWGTLETVSGESPYVADLVKSIESVLEAVRSQVEQKKYLRNYYDKAASLLITRFTNTLVRSRPMKEVGAEQVMIDLQGFKSCLLRFPQGSENSALSATYAKTVTKSTTRLETLLKVINSPTDPSAGFVTNYTLLVGDHSFSNFQKVLDLKGTPRSEQNGLLDIFLTMTSTMSELESTSFLSSLDMDPPPGPVSAGSIITPNSSAISVPSLLVNATGGSSTLGMMTPPLGSGTETSKSSPAPGGEGKREVFSDLRRLVNFAVRRDTTNNPS